MYVAKPFLPVSRNRRRCDYSLRPLSLLFASPLMAVLSMMALCLSSGTSSAAPPSGEENSVTVLPLLSSREASPIAADLTGIIFTELGKYEGLEILIRQPSRPLSVDCALSAPCLRQLGTELDAQRLLIGAATGADGVISVRLFLFDVRRSLLVEELSIDMTGRKSKFGRKLRPIVAQLAKASGGWEKGAKPVIASVPDSESLEDLLEDVPTQPASIPTTATERPHEEASTRHASSHPSTAPPPPDDEEIARMEKRRAVALKERRRKAAKARYRQRQLERRERDKRMEEERRRAEKERERQIKEAQERAEEESRRRKEATERRRENIKRAKKGLPPLPEPGQPEAPQKSVLDDVVPTSARTAQTSNSVEKNGKNGIKQTGARSRASGEGAPKPPVESQTALASTSSKSGLGRSSNEKAKTVFLENDGPYQFGLIGSVSYFANHGFLGIGLEGAYAIRREIWVEARVKTISSSNASEESWFYLVEGAAGVFRRYGNQRVHPYLGAEVAGVLFGPGLIAPGALGRVGLDMMASEGLAIRLDLSGGILYSDALSNTQYNYPSATQLVFDLGVGSSFRF